MTATRRINSASNTRCLSRSRSISLRTIKTVSAGRRDPIDWDFSKSINWLKPSALLLSHGWVQLGPLLHCRMSNKIWVIAAVISLKLEVALWTFSFCLGCLLSWRKPVVRGGWEVLLKPSFGSPSGHSGFLVVLKTVPVSLCIGSYLPRRQWAPKPQHWCWRQVKSWVSGTAWMWQINHQ